LGTVKLLDCTLRDGGYINNWKFGEAIIKDVVTKTVEAGIDIVEIGFLRDEPYDPDRAIFNTNAQIKAVIGRKWPHTMYSAMVEISNPMPVDLLGECDPDSIDIIRIIVWKEMLQESLRYARQIQARGYKVCIQPVRINQYTEKEFIDTIQLFNTLAPFAFYIVDSWGVMSAEKLMPYIKLADMHLSPETSLGLHGHDNKQQTLTCACSFFFTQSPERNIIVDGSVMGIGRGAGNLSIEVFASYLNDHSLNNWYNIQHLLTVGQKYICPIQSKHPWGYSLMSFLTAEYVCNPEYIHFMQDKELSVDSAMQFLSGLSPIERLTFKKDKAEQLLEVLCGSDS